MLSAVRRELAQAQGTFPARPSRDRSRPDRLRLSGEWGHLLTVPGLLLMLPSLAILVAEAAGLP